MRHLANNYECRVYLLGKSLHAVTLELSKKKERKSHSLPVGMFFVQIIKAARWVFPPQLHNIKLICVSLSSRLKAPPIANDGTFFRTDCLESTSGQHASLFFPSELDVHPGLLVCNLRVNSHASLLHSATYTHKNVATVSLCSLIAVQQHVCFVLQFPVVCCCSSWFFFFCGGFFVMIFFCICTTLLFLVASFVFPYFCTGPTFLFFF